MPRFLYLILLFVLLCTSCNKVLHREHQAPQSIPVAIMVLDSQTDAAASSSVYRSYVGHVTAATSLPLTYPLGGRITALYVRNGEHVTEGQLLAEVDSTEAKSLHTAAAAVLRQAEDASSRLRQVYDKGGVADVRWVEMETDLEKARQSEAIARKRLNDCRLTAPSAGVVSALDIHIGQTVLPGQPILTLLDLSSLEAEFSVPEQDVSTLQVGRVVRISVDAARTNALSGRITEKGLTGGAFAHAYTMHASINDGAGLLPGMVCKVQVPAERTDGIIIPGACVSTTPQGPAVWIIKQNRAERRHIEVERYVSEGVLVSEGLVAGDTIVTGGYQKLYSGAEVSF